VKLDETRLGQVLVNLMINAAHAIDPGHAADHRVIVRAAATDDEVMLEVSDTGKGIPAEIAARIFEPYFTTKVGVGTGLGLAICQGIVKGAGGAIDVKSELGKGTTFRITLPRSTTGAPAKSPVITRIARARILLVDDEPLVLQAVRRILSEHDVTSFEDPIEALAALQHGASFDAIICEIGMSALDGIAIYERLLEKRPELAARMIFLTGGAINARVASFIGAIPNACLEKPVRKQDLLVQIAKVIADNRS
jgi:CheY-like chemotaxis protein